MKKYDLVILAGGKGTRIKKQIKDLPKPMAHYLGFNFLDYILFSTSKYLFNNIYIIAGHRGKIIKKKYNNKKINVSKINVVIEKKLKGTGGALNDIKTKIKNDFFLINGDTIFDFNYLDLLKILKENSVGSMSLVNNNNYKYNKKLNNLNIGKNKDIIIDKNSRFMNGGVYFFKKKILEYLKRKEFSLENELLVELIQKKKIKGKVFDNFFLDIGTPKNFLEAKKKIKNHFFKPAIFLDRDGVLNYDKGYTYKIEDCRIISKTINYLSNKIGKYYLFIVTNQAGIAKKKFSLIDFKKFQHHLLKKLMKKNILINDYRFCPHHEKAQLKKYRKTCHWRKPNNGMIKNLIDNWPIILNDSFFIGDSVVDKLAAKKSNLKYLNINNIK